MPPPSGYTPPSGANDAGADPAALDSGASSPNVSFTYDTAGNRATMTDALGTTAYNYDTWSHLTSETRTFTDLAGYGSNLGSYSIDYTYNLGGQLTSIRDPFRSAGANHTVSYAYDKLGQLTGINATGYKDGYWNNSSQWITPDVPVLASQITHRAWGATTHASYGNNLTLSATYNQQMQPVHFKVSSIYNNAPYLVIAGDYERAKPPKGSKQVTTTKPKAHAKQQSVEVDLSIVLEDMKPQEAVLAPQAPAEPEPPPVDNHP